MSKFRDYDNYEVFENGRIWSYKTKRFLKPKTEKNGYQRVLLYDNEGKRKMYLLHRVVWEAVTGSPIPEGMQINHMNEIKTSNMITNLELVSPKQNINYGNRTEKFIKARSKQVGAYKDGKLIFTFQSTKEAQRQGYHSGAVSACCRGERKTHKGYEWRYI